MDQRVSSMVAPFCLILIVSYFLSASGNTEVKALYAFKLNLVDPNGVLRTWDPTLINPCSWDHIYCSTDNSAIAVRLGNANLTGILAPQLGDLRNLQSFDLAYNNLSGVIPFNSSSLFFPRSFAGNPGLTMPEAGPPPSLPFGNSATTTIAGGAASLCAAVAFALAWW